MEKTGDRVVRHVNAKKNRSGGLREGGKIKTERRRERGLRMEGMSGKGNSGY